MNTYKIEGIEIKGNKINQILQLFNSPVDSNKEFETLLFPDPKVNVNVKHNPIPNKITNKSNKHIRIFSLIVEV